jgi:hypothetical protein
MRPILIVVTLLLMFASSCGERKGGESNESISEDEPADLPDDDDGSVELLNVFTESGDSITIPEFEIEVDLTDEAENLLERSNESIIVQAYITGVPKDGANIEVTEMGEVYLANPNIELIESRIARFQKVNIPAKSFASLADEDFQVLINIFSGRRSTGVNLLDCEILQAPISVVRGQKHTLAGKLIDGSGT